MAGPSGFAWKRRKNDEVLITHRGRKAATLRGTQATDFIEEMELSSESDAQESMARLTGNYRRGNERQARDHPRNRG